MKKFASTWIFAVVVIALGTYVFWDFTEQKKMDELQEGEVRLTEFSPSDVTALDVKKKDLLIQIERKDGQCRIVHPIKDQCDVIAVESLLTAVSPLKGRAVMKASELKKDADDYGLKDPAAVAISWKLKEGKNETLKIGTKNSFDGGFYLLKDGTVYVVDRSVGQASNKGLDELRSKTVLPEIKDVREFSLGAITLKKENEDWTFVDKAPYPADSFKVQEWVGALKRLKATKVVDERPALPSTPEWTIKVSAADTSSHQVEFFKKTESLYVAKESSQEKFFEIPFSRLGEIFVQREHFYDGRAPFKFPLEQVVNAKVSVDGKALEFQKKEKKWEAIGQHPKLKESELTSFFQKLSQLEAESFKGPKNAHFTKKNQITLSSSSQGTVLELQWGDKFEKDSLRAVRVTGKPGVFGVPEKQMKELLAVDFFE